MRNRKIFSKPQPSESNGDSKIEKPQHTSTVVGQIVELNKDGGFIISNDKKYEFWYADCLIKEPKLKQSVQFQIMKGQYAVQVKYAIERNKDQVKPVPQRSERPDHTNWREKKPVIIENTFASQLKTVEDILSSLAKKKLEHEKYIFDLNNEIEVQTAKRVEILKQVEVTKTMLDTRQTDFKVTNKQLIALITDGKTDAAVDLLKQIPYNFIFHPTFPHILSILSNPRQLDPSLVNDVVRIVTESVKYKYKSKMSVHSILADQKSLIVGYNRNLNIRNHASFTKITGALFDGDGFMMGFWFPAIHKYTWEELLNSQSFLSMMAIAKPKNVGRNNNLYLLMKEQISKKEEERTLKLTGKKKEVMVENKDIKQVFTEKTKEDPEEPEILEGGFVMNEEQEQLLARIENMNLQEVSVDDDRITSEAYQFLSTIPQSKEVRNKKEEIRTLVEQLFNKIQKDQCSVFIYGSSESTFGLKDSDVDLCARFEHNSNLMNKGKEQGQYLMMLKKELDTGKYPLKADGNPIGNTRVPVLKLIDPLSKIECDVCIDNFLGVLNSRMLRCYSMCDERVRQLTLIVKHWTKKRNIADPSAGLLSSYSYVLMVFYYLQNISPPILPSLQELALKVEDTSLLSKPSQWNAFDTNYFSAIEKLREFWKVEPNTLTLGELIQGFFAFYSKFDFEGEIICVRTGTSLQKKKDNAPISIEDPFEKRDLGKVLDEKTSQVVLKEFARASELLHEGGLEALFEAGDDRVSKFTSNNQKYPEHLSLVDARKGLEDGTLFQGVLRVNAKRFREAYVTVEGRDDDILIPGFKERNRSIHGDLVAVKLVEQNGKMCGNVVCILEKRSPTLFVCNLMKDPMGNTQHHRWLIPLEKIYPKFVMENRNVFDTKPQNFEDMILIVEVKEWTVSQHHAKAKIIATIGYQKDLWSQKRALLIQAMPHLYEHIIKKTQLGVNIKQEVTDITEFDTNEYEDWRKKVIFTIDPLTSRDLDDAVAIEKVGDSYECIVAIADVSKFIPEGDFNDIEAQKRSTSVYMVDSVEHMLDPSLSQNMCSLLPGVNRFGLCVKWTMDSHGVIDDKTVKFHRVILQSCCKLDYDTVQEILDGKNPTAKPVHNGVKWERISKDCLLLNQLAKELRTNRAKGGSLFLHSDQLNFNVNENGYPLSVKKDEHSESHQLIEEFMLVANQLAAKKIAAYSPNACLLRTHDAPNEDKLKEMLNEYCVSFNKNIAKTPFDMSLIESKSISEITAVLFKNTADFPDVHLTMHNLLLRQMHIAVYSLPPLEEKPFHYALGVNYYTHFTSPIRRYADLIVHRLLLSSMKEEKTGKKSDLMKRVDLGQIIEHINEQTLKARHIQDQTVKMYFAHYLIPLLSRGAFRVPAVVLSLGSRSFTVFIPKYGFELKINVMKSFVTPPDNITDVGLRDEEESTTIECVTLVWNETRKLELKILKTLVIELNVDYSMTPYDIYAYNAYDYDEKLL